MAARIIVRIPYLKNSTGAVGYTNYIATREGVDKSINAIRSDKPVTKKQVRINGLYNAAEHAKREASHVDNLSKEVPSWGKIK